MQNELIPENKSAEMLDELFESIQAHNEAEATAAAIPDEIEEPDAANPDPIPKDLGERPGPERAPKPDPEPFQNPLSSVRADFALMIADMILSKILAVGVKIATKKKVDAAQFRLTTDEAAAILPAFEVVFKDVVQNLKPSHILLVTAGAIYGAKVYDAVESSELEKKTASRKFTAKHATDEQKAKRGRPRKVEAETQEGGEE